MAYKVIIKTLAEEEITQAVEWYFNKSVNLAKDLIQEIDDGLNSIKENPLNFQKRYKELRIIFIQRFPYGIYYTIEGNVIFVHAVLHNKQNPEAGIERI